MRPTVVHCEAAVAHCVTRLAALKANLADVERRPESPKREQLIGIAANAVRALEMELESLRRDLNTARERERGPHG